MEVLNQLFNIYITILNPWASNARSDCKLYIRYITILQYVFTPFSVYSI